MALKTQLNLVSTDFLKIPTFSAVLSFAPFIFRAFLFLIQAVAERKVDLA
jgi:hypothetical protein